MASLSIGSIVLSIWCVENGLDCLSSCFRILRILSVYVMKFGLILLFRSWWLRWRSLMLMLLMLWSSSSSSLSSTASSSWKNRFSSSAGGWSALAWYWSAFAGGHLDTLVEYIEIYHQDYDTFYMYVFQYELYFSEFCDLNF